MFDLLPFYAVNMVYSQTQLPDRQIIGAKNQTVRRDGLCADHQVISMPAIPEGIPAVSCVAD
jgi:hypothetical protein